MTAEPSRLPGDVRAEGRLRLSDARTVQSVLADFELQIGKRDKCLSSSHEHGLVSVTMPTETARQFVRAIKEALG